MDTTEANEAKKKKKGLFARAKSKMMNSMMEKMKEGCCGPGADEAMKAHFADFMAKAKPGEGNDPRDTVRQTYAEVARQGNGCGCGCGPDKGSEAVAKAIGYSDADVTAAPEGANMGLGCGNPQAIAELQEGETVVDLGSGGGFDAFLASPKVGESGQVIGVDMTPDMITKARKNSETGGFTNVEFRLGEIENLPVADGSADVVISNCVINLSPDKEAVYREIYRVLKPGGRIAISDVALLQELPEELEKTAALYTSCIAGAVTVEKVAELLERAGFTQISLEKKEAFADMVEGIAPGLSAGDYITSLDIRAVKPV